MSAPPPTTTTDSTTSSVPPITPETTRVQNQERVARVINTVRNVTATAEDYWNTLCQGADFDNLLKMIKECGGNSLRDAGVLIGKKCLCHGSTGLGTYPAIIQQIDVGKGWIEVWWTEDKYSTWKTAKLCWLEESEKYFPKDDWSVADTSVYVNYAVGPGVEDVPGAVPLPKA
eukprot:PhF_6_TR43500/c0_g4_i2/m.66778